ncbi:MAG: 16S rRNA (uracil(1498)-N(3))-methyltransferase [Rhodocyclaceae bacterium]|jgi:16S rRNA (uracil1498-N3)-methyltransferase|nr:16S rRNA (uracil(1498)-N(3))-methyltransferase [Rhodocyclaceae bacterium]
MPPRFYCPIPLAARRTVDLPGAAAHHALRVLRLKSGDEVTLFNGEGGEYPGRIAGTGRAVRVELGEWRDIERESALGVTLAQALPSGDKMDRIVQKAVELGVARLAPLAAARSVVRLSGERAARRVEHWRSVAVSACEQCGRNRLPDILPLLDLRQWLSELAPGKDEARLLLSPQAELRLRDVRPQGGVVLLIGPEGGLTGDEAAAARAAGFRGASLGPRILRTETAGMAALAALAALHGDF